MRMGCTFGMEGVCTVLPPLRSEGVPDAVVDVGDISCNLLGLYEHADDCGPSAGVDGESTPSLEYNFPGTMVGMNAGLGVKSPAITWFLSGVERCKVGAGD